MISNKLGNREISKKMYLDQLSPSHLSTEKEFQSDLDSLFNNSSQKKQQKIDTLSNPTSKLKITHEICQRSSSLCANCTSSKLTLLDYKEKYELTLDKLFATEKQLKQYDTLLNIKDKRLKEQESALKSEKELFDDERQKFDECKYQENEKIVDKLTEIQNEKEINYHILAEIEEKYKEVKNIINEYETTKQSFEDKVRNEVYKEYWIKEAALQNLEELLLKKIEEFNKAVEEKESFLIEYENSVKDAEEKLCKREETLKLKLADLLEIQKEVKSAKYELENDLTEKERYLKRQEKEMESDKEYIKCQLNALDQEIKKV